MKRAGLVHTLITVAALTMWAAHAGAQQQVSMTVEQLFKSNHQIEVVAGTEVFWADPHFDRVWFPAGSGAPAVERDSKGLHAVFSRPGIYRGSFIVVAGHGTNDVYTLTVTVREASK
jgi:hypothetical protein